MKESEIRPKELFDRYLKLSSQDALGFFQAEELQRTACPSCGQEGELQFTKLSFGYDRCSACLTLFANPRPTELALQRYYREAPSVQFWATDFYKQTADARREKLWKPKAEKLNEWIASLENAPAWVCDIGGGYGIFAEEFSKISGKPTLVIEPGPSLAAVCRQKGFTVIEKRLEDTLPADLPAGRGCFTSFELFEHVQNPRQFLKAVFDLLPSGGYFYFTTLSGVGLDILAMGEDSNAVFPPHHLNFFNPKSLAALLLDLGYVDVAISTPGKLDVDILKNNCAQLAPAWKHLVNYLSDAQQTQLQGFLAEQGLSSHMATLCQKP